MAQTGKKAAAGGSGNKKGGKKAAAKKSAPKNKGTKSTKCTKSTKSTKSTSSYNKASQGKAARRPAAAQSGVKKEIVMLLAVALGALLLAADLNFLGRVGHDLRRWQMGLVGTMAYLLPVWIIAQTGYILFVNDWEGKRLLTSAVMFPALCGIATLLGGRAGESGATVQQIFAEGISGFNGGVVGGVIANYLMSRIDMTGAYLVLALVFIICVVVTFQIKLIEGSKQKAEDWSRNKEARAARREQYREDQMALREEKKAYQEEHRLYKEEKRRESRKRKLEKQTRRLREKHEREQEERRQAGYPDAGTDSRTESGTVRRIDRHPPNLIFAENMRDEVPGTTPAAQTENIPGTSDSRKRSGGRSVSGKNRKKTGDIREIRPEEAYDRRGEDELVARKISREELDQFREPEPEPAQTPEDRYSDLVITGVTRPVPPEDLFPEEIPGDFNIPEPVVPGDGSRETFLPEAEEEEDFAEEITRERLIPGEDIPESPFPEDAVPEEDSMAAYDEFETGDPRAVLRGEGGYPMDKTAGGRGSAWGTGSVWESSDNSGSNAGRTFSRKKSGGNAPAASHGPVPAEELFPEKREEPPVKKEYTLPTTALLKDAVQKGGISEESLRRTAQKLETTLNNFGVRATMKTISCGPSVTRYELEPAQGVKVRKIVDLTDDLKLNLEATDIRIEAPIPGKAAVGIEVPNEVKQTVSLKEILDAEAFRRSASKVSFAVGKDIGGDVIVADLAKMPHLLIAGATGSGKSVCINSLIASILFKAKPDEVQLVMIDPKVVELSVYNGIPHLHFPVVTDPKKAASALNWAVTEMTARYKKFADTGTRDIRGYNRKIEEQEGETCARMPQIVIIVDELADLMMVAAGEVEEAICRLAQLARAAGIHLVLATQRPSVNVITGLIKANVPSRIAFSVSSGVDSRTIIDMVGAEKLLGNGDMLFYPSGYPKPVRIQGAFVSDTEVLDLVKFWSDQNSDEPRTEADLDRALESSGAGAGPSAERDDLFQQAGFFIIDKEKASIGNLQRAFRIGFNRAARIMDQLCDYGVVGPEEGTKARQILMTREQFEELLSNL